MNRLDMTDFRALEYDSLRAAIRVRSVAGPALLVFTILGWAALTLWVFTTDVVSAAALVPLIVLAAGFEALYQLHVHTTRLALYLHVAYDATWETTSLSYRQRFGAFGSNSLFAALFILATLVNFVPAAVSGAPEELAGIGIAHALLVIRIILASRRATRLEAEDLERFRSLLSSSTSTTTKNAPAE
jgi:hypothetical protein